MKPLTPRQKEILGYIVSHSRVTYPTVREVARAFGLSASSVQDHIQALRKKGHLIPQNPLDSDLPNSRIT